MKDDQYTRKLEDVIKQMLIPLKNIPFNLVIESLTGRKVIPFDPDNTVDQSILERLKETAIRAGGEINKNGIVSRRPNEVGNYIETFVKDALRQLSLNPDVPCGSSGRKKAAGYPDIVFYVGDKPYYLECKTYNLKNVATTQRSFYFSPSDDFKVIHDTHHFMLCYEMEERDDSNVFECKHYKILSLESLFLDIKYEFNSDNRRMYSGTDGAIILAEGKIR